MRTLRNGRLSLVAVAGLLLIVAMCSSCSSRQYIGTRVYIHKVEDISGGSKDLIQKVTVMKPSCYTPAEVVLDDKHVEVKPAKESGLETVRQGTLTGTDAKHDYAFSGWRHAVLPQSVPLEQRVFRYYERQVFLQPVTIALRFRREAIKDTVPAQATTGFNAGFALGLKLSKIYWRPNKNLFGSQTQRYSLGGGLLFSMGAVELNEKNTRDPQLRFPRNVPVLTYGGLVTLGLGSVNMGMALGIDRTFTKQTDGWLYQGEPWWGLVLGLDVVK